MADQANFITCIHLCTVQRVKSAAARYRKEHPDLKPPNAEACRALAPPKETKLLFGEYEELLLLLLLPSLPILNQHRGAAVIVGTI